MTEQKTVMLEEASCLLGQLNGVFEKREQTLQKARADFKHQTEAFEREKKLMQTVSVADNDIVNLNVGGTFLSTKRSTLTQAEGSALAARFSGRWEQCVDHDSEGRVFLDFDPYCFQQILFYLRSCTIRSNAVVPLPEVEACKRNAYLDLVKYLALEDYMGYCTVNSLRFLQASPGVQIANDGRQAKAAVPGVKYRSVVVGPTIDDVGYLKCKMHQVANWMFLGIGQDINLASETNYSTTTSYGWSKNKYQWTKGTHMSAPTVHWSNGDWVLIKADLRSGRLSMLASQVNTPCHISTVGAAEGQKQYVFHVILFDTGDEVELLPVTAEDQQLLP